MSKKFYFIGLIGTVILMQVMYFITGALIDPIGMFGAPLVRGFNHFKVKQGLFCYVFHPYAFLREQPYILYIGASEVGRGFEPTEAGSYTMGLPGARLMEVREYLRFVYTTHKPKVVYLGLGLTMLGNDPYKLNNKGFSTLRLERLKGNILQYWIQAANDSYGLHDVYVETIKGSLSHIDDNERFFRGWFADLGRNQPINSADYYRYYAGGVERQRIAFGKPNIESLDAFHQIVIDAQAEGVLLIPFFTPNAVEVYATSYLSGYLPAIHRIKREVATVHPIYDFNFVNELSTNRELWAEPWHFRASLGERIKPILEGKTNPEPYGYLLTPETCDAALAAEETAWEKWKSENAEYVQALTECIESGRKPEVGDFAKYIGF